ncbi:MAG TPA: PucR family transcriptional regulator ligand-binding domain-containing protein [Nocardioidaceae bacterium]|nr:PucR family transcriptional regulator ligand-binding domain-containing protein [Nocardioidaceae bacterium]
MVDVSTLLAQSELGLRAHHLPRGDAEMRWVATCELEDPGPFLEGGELLLTTGLATHGWRTQWSGYVARLVDAGVVALALGVGLTHPRMPVALMRACEKHGLNLVEVPRDTTFVGVSRAAARLIEKRDEAEARLALETQRQLTSAAMRDDSAQAVVERLAALLDGAAFLLAPDGRLMLGPVGPRHGLSDVDAAQAELPRIRPHGLRAAATLNDQQGTTLLVPVGLRDRPLSYLGVGVAGRLTDVRRNAVTTAVALLGLVGAQEQDQLETRRRVWRKVHELLAHGDLEVATLLGEAMGAPALPRRPRVLRVAGPDDVLEDVLSELEGEPLLAARVEAELWVVCSRGQSKSLIERLADRRLRVGAGDSHLTAGQALSRATDSQRVVHWERVVQGSAVGLLDPEVATAFADSLLAPLDEQLRETLTSFLRHHGSRLKVAEELGVHRNTVRNRIEAIETELGRSLDDPDTRASAWLALQARL